MHTHKQVHSLHLEVLGETSCASALAYLDSGVLFVGSASGDSQVIYLVSVLLSRPCIYFNNLYVCAYMRVQCNAMQCNGGPFGLPTHTHTMDNKQQLVRLNTERDEAGSYLSVEASYTSLAPILDMCLLEPTSEGGGGGSKQAGV